MTKIITLLDSIYKTYESLDDGLNWSEEHPNLKLDNVCRIDLTFFLTCLSGDNNLFTLNQSNYIKDVLDWELTPQQLREFWQDNSEQSKNIPITLQISVKADNMLKEKGLFEISTAEIFIDTCEILGKDFLMRTSTFSDTEQSTLFKYLSKLKKYVSEGSIVNLQNTYHTINNEETEMNEKTSDEEYIVKETLEELLDELNSLIGLDNIKNDVNSDN